MAAPPEAQPSPWLSRWMLMVYGGVPMQAAFSNARAVGANHNIPFPGLGVETMPVFGGRLERSLTPHLTAGLEAWRDKAKIPIQDGIGRHFTQELYTVSPSLQGTAPLDALGMPQTQAYLGAGPTISQTNQCDETGCSAPSMDLGAQLYGGVKVPLSDHWRAMAEVKYHRANVAPEDPQGAFHGKYSNVMGLLGLGYEF